VKKYIILIAVNALLLLAFAACLITSGVLKGSLRSQQAAKAWEGQSGERFAQISVFMQGSRDFNDEAIFNLRNSINSALIGASLESTDGRILYTDAWSAEGEVTVIGGRSPVPVNAYGVGGDFFLFHPLYLRDGSYLSPNDLMKDRVVIDEELAWRLFGSLRVAGFEVVIGEKLHVIAGVISRENDFASLKAYTSGAGLFMSYESLNELSGGEAKISCYEIVLPDPITGFALKTISEVFPDKQAHIVENSARYSTAAVFAAVGAFGEPSMRADVMVYPYWENAARYIGDWLALLLVLMLVFIAFPVVNGVFFGVKGIIYLVRRGKSTVARMIEERDVREAEKYLRENAGEKS